MFILLKPKPISNKTKVYLVKSYRDVNKIPRYKIIKSFGSYHTLLKKDPLIIDKLKKQAKYTSVKGITTNKIVIEPSKPSEWHRTYNIGYLFCKAIIETYRPLFLKEIEKKKLGKFYRFVLYKMIFGNQVNFQHELYFEGPFDPNTKIPSYIQLQKLLPILGIKTDSYILIVQRLSVYYGNESKDRLFYLLLNNNGFPAYFHLANINLDRMESNLLEYVQYLEKKFNAKVYVCEHPNITPWVKNASSLWRSYRNYEKNLKMKQWLETSIDFSLEQIKVLNHTIIGINKFISDSVLSLPEDATDNILQLAGFIHSMQIGVFNFYRYLYFVKLKGDFLLQDIQETLKTIIVAGGFQNYTNIVLNANNQSWKKLYHVIFDKNKILELIPNAYLDINKFNEKYFIKYISEHLLKVIKF